MAHPNFVEKTFAGGSKTANFVNVFSLERFPLYSIFVRDLMVCRDQVHDKIECRSTAFHLSIPTVCGQFHHIISQRSPKFPAILESKLNALKEMWYDELP